MKKLTFILLLLSLHGQSQIHWKNYATAFVGEKEDLSLALAIPYHGVMDNFSRNVVGYSHWNTDYDLNIDTALDVNIPLFFIYDTTDIYVILPGVDAQRANTIEYTVLLNNRDTVVPWTMPEEFTGEVIAGIEMGSAMTAGVHTGIDNYLVVNLRDKFRGKKASVVLYYQKAHSGIKSIMTTDNPDIFSMFVSDYEPFGGRYSEFGGYRQNPEGNWLHARDSMSFSYAHNNILVETAVPVFNKEALEYSLRRGGKMVRDWASNKYDHSYILLKDLEPGVYSLDIRMWRQRENVSSFYFSVAPPWYKTTVFQVSAFGFLLLLIALIVFILKQVRQRKLLRESRKNTEQLTGELKGIQSLLNPHFTFNALNSIQGLINKGDIEGANKYLSSFAALLRETLRESGIESIPLTKELENLQTYIELEQLRHSFEYRLDIDEKINTASVSIPPFILQPYVENAIKHGMASMGSRGMLGIKINKEGDRMLIDICDNGTGFDAAVSRGGYGLELSRKRIALLNNEYGEELITLQVNSSGNGTSVLISFLKWL